jgi:hypothetical protein
VSLYLNTSPLLPSLPSPSFQSTARPFSFAQRLPRAPRFFADPYGSPAVHRRARPAAMAPLDGEEVGFE